MIKSGSNPQMSDMVRAGPVIIWPPRSGIMNLEHSCYLCVCQSWIHLCKSAALFIPKGGRHGVSYGSLSEKVVEEESEQPMLPGTPHPGDQATKERHILFLRQSFF